MTERVLAAGHRNIAMIAGIAAGNDRARDRIAGVRRAIAAHGDGATLTMVVQSRYLLDDAAAAYHRVMAGPIRPTAIIGGSDVLAASAIVQAVASGLRVPQDVSVTGFDDIGLASVVAPSLTTVHVPQHEMGEAAARMLLARLSGDTTQKSVQFDAPIVMRGSLGNLPVN
jgi:LacI family transcriptional regulator